jgi:rubredoxin-NAD+ reductase
LYVNSRINNINLIYINLRIVMKKYVCDVCGWEYDPTIGVPEANILPNTAWEDVAEDFACPLCGVGKDEFSAVEE